MIRTMRVIFCCEEHGTGDATYPDVVYGVPADEIVNARGTASLRAAAKKEGWAYITGLDYCPNCVNAMIERGEYKPRLKADRGDR